MDDREAEKRLEWMLFDCVFIVLGIVGMFSSQFLTPYTGLTVFIITFGICATFTGITVFEMVHLTYSVDKHMKELINFPQLRKEITQELEHFKTDKSGILWVWAVCFLTIIVMSIAWFTLSWPAFMILDAILAAYSFPPSARLAITLVSNVISWFLILMTLGLLFWAFINSGRRETETYGV